MFSGEELKRATRFSVGYDIKSNVQVTLKAHVPTAIPTGVYMKAPEGYWGKIEGRSSLALKGIQVLGGIIDPDYEGEVKVILMSVKDYLVKRGDKVAQLVFLPFTAFEEAEGERGDGGFGSSGR